MRTLLSLIDGVEEEDDLEVEVELEGGDVVEVKKGGNVVEVEGIRGR